VAVAVGTVLGALVALATAKRKIPFRLGTPLGVGLAVVGAASVVPALLLQSALPVAAAPDPEDWINRLDERTRGRFNDLLQKVTAAQQKYHQQYETLIKDGRQEEANRVALADERERALKERIADLGRQIDALNREKVTATAERQKEIQAFIDRLTEELKELEKYQRDLEEWAGKKDNTPPPQPPSPTDGRKSSDPIGDLLKLPFEVIGKVLSIIGKLLGLGGGEEYRNEVRRVINKSLTGEPITPEDIDRVAATLKGDEQAKAKATELLKQLQDALPPVHAARQKANADVVDKAAVDRLVNAYPEILELERLLKGKSATDLDKMSTDQLKKVLTSNEKFTSAGLKQAAGKYLQVKYPALHAKHWPALEKLGVLAG
jgi:hypothetical protein